MTNPLTELELAACHEAWLYGHHRTSFDNFEQGFAAALDYLRAELAKEEPVAWRAVEEDGKPATDWIDGNGAGVVFGRDFRIQRAYLRSIDLMDNLGADRPAPGVFKQMGIAEDPQFPTVGEPSTSKEKDHG